MVLGREDGIRHVILQIQYYLREEVADVLHLDERFKKYLMLGRIGIRSSRISRREKNRLVKYRKNESPLTLRSACFLMILR